MGWGGRKAGCGVGVSFRGLESVLVRSASWLRQECGPVSRGWNDVVKRIETASHQHVNCPLGRPEDALGDRARGSGHVAVTPA